MPENNTPVVSQIAIKVNGSYLSNDLMDRLLDVEVDTSLDTPDMFIIRFHDDDLSLVDDENTFKLGAMVIIEFPKANATLTPTLTGEITAIEPAFSENFTATLTIRGYDKRHRLTRGTKSRAFLNVKDSDIAQKIAGEAGLSIKVDASTVVHEHVIQHNQTDLEFLRDRARRIGYEVALDDKMLYFRQPKGTRGTLTLSWGVELRNFHPRLSLSGQVSQVKVYGWDTTQKREIVGQSKASPHLNPKTGISASGGALAQQSFSSAELIEVHMPVTTQQEAENLAQAIYKEVSAGFIEAQGVAYGNGDLVAGKQVTLQKLGKRFSGTYMVTSATHYYSSVGGYDTHFTIEGAYRTLVSDLVGGKKTHSETGGVVIGVVTNNKDPKNMGRVKVKFPWLNTTLESHWIRMATIGGGNKRGIHWLPEVNDEVLVAFEHGDFNTPYILGGLYNGKDAPPATTDTAVKGADVVNRYIQTKKHIITLTEEPSKEIIELRDLANKTIVRLTATPAAKIEILVPSGDAIVKATNINAEATAKADVKGAQVTVEASATLTLKGAVVNVESSGPLKIKGAVVNIN